VSYTLADRRAWVRQFARNAQDSSAYPDAEIDRAMHLAADEWVRLTKATRQLSTLALTAGSAALPSLPDDCMPEKFLQSFLTLSGRLIDPKFQLTSYEAVLAAQANLGAECGYFPTATSSGSPTSGQPKMMGFQDRGTGIVYPTPDAAYAVNVWWWAPVTSFRAGVQGDWSSSTAYVYGDVVADSGTLYSCVQGHTNQQPPNTSYWTSLGADAGGAIDDPATLTFNLPDDHLRAIDTFGTPAFLQFTEPTKAFASDSFQHLMALAAEFKSRGAGGRGGGVSTKAAAE
jgi:hypothetical protein